jgi:hypothetical protein
VCRDDGLPVDVIAAVTAATASGSMGVDAAWSR